MRAFALASNKIGDKQTGKKRISWNEEKLSKALIGLKTRSVAEIAGSLGTSETSLRLALARRGFSLRGYRAHKATVKRISHKSGQTAFIQGDLGENAPALAMAAFENKPAFGCSWPIGDLAGEDFYFCGERRLAGKSYCRECFAKSVIETKPINDFLKDIGYIR